MNTTYLDYAAATPLDPEVLRAMSPYFSDIFYNPSSSYLAARDVKKDIEHARARVAHWLGAKPAEIIFTAGATESINLAIRGVMHNFPDGHLLLSATEHDAVFGAANSINHEVVKVDVTGSLDLNDLKKNINDDTVLISVALANNEIGTIQPMREIASIIADVRKRRALKNNALPIYLHTDASQAGSFLDLHVARMGVDLMTLNGGKMYGPKQSGILYVKAGITLEPQIRGGGQQMGMRSGTENVASIIGFATALDIAQTNRNELVQKLQLMRDQLQNLIVQKIDGVKINGNQKKRLPNNLNISLPGVDGERLVMLMDEQGVQISTGSACGANKQTKSHVLAAIGLSDNEINGSLRFSLGKYTTQKDIENAVDILRNILEGKK